MRRNPRIGSTFDDLLREEGALEEVEARAQKRVFARHHAQLASGGEGKESNLPSRSRETTRF